MSEDAPMTEENLEFGGKYYEEALNDRIVEENGLEELTSTDAKSEIGRRMRRAMIVKEARAGDRRRSQKIVERGKCVVCT